MMHDAVVHGTFVAAQFAPGRNRLVPRFAGRRIRTSLDVRERGVVGGDHPGAATAFDGEIAKGHSLFHREVREPTEPVYSTTWWAAPAVPMALSTPERSVLRRHTNGKRALDAHLHRCRTGLTQALGGQDMLDLGRADTERECPEGAVRGSVGIAADDDGARQGQPQLRPDHVDDALPAMAGAEARDCRVVAVLPQRVHLRHAHRVGAGDAVTVGGDVVVHRGNNQPGPANAPALDPEAFECLWRSDLVHQVQVDVEQ